MIPRKAGRALDLGAGNGILSYALAREGWSVTAVEPDPSALVVPLRSGRLPKAQARPSMWSKRLGAGDPVVRRRL